MPDNGDLKSSQEKAQEKLPLEAPKVGGIPSPEENKKEAPQTPPTDFKVAEIWIRQGRVFIDAQQEFWADKCRALGLLEYCKDIVKDARTAPEPKIMPARGSMMNFARKIFNKRKR